MGMHSQSVTMPLRALRALAADGSIDSRKVAEAVVALGIDPEKSDPMCS